MNVAGRTLNLTQLQDEIEAAQIEIRGLGTAADDLFTYNADGEAIDIPPEAYSIVDQHEPYDPPPTKQEVLLSLLDGIETADDSTEILLLVQREMLRP